jgi:DNA-binding transcriptional LysR family regulator
LNLVRAFAAVHEAGSFSGAAKRLKQPRSSISRAVSALETSLGTVLFHRTTRRVATTVEGKLLFERIAPLLEGLDAALSDVPEQEEVASGTLRLTSAVDIGSAVLADVVARFSARHPRIRTEVHLTSSLVDLVRDGFDAAIRIASGKLRGANLTARKLGALSIGMYASPSYLARRGVPRSTAELAGHDLIGFRGASGELLAGAGELAQKAKPRLECDDMFFMRELVKSGAGVAAMPSFVADSAVASGELSRILPRWSVKTGSVYLVYPTSKHVPLRVALFRDVLVDALRQRPLGPADALG